MPRDALVFDFDRKGPQLEAAFTFGLVCDHPAALRRGFITGAGGDM